MKLIKNIYFYEGGPGGGGGEGGVCESFTRIEPRNKEMDLKLFIWSDLSSLRILLGDKVLRGEMTTLWSNILQVRRGSGSTREYVYRVHCVQRI